MRGFKPHEWVAALVIVVAAAFAAWAVWTMPGPADFITRRFRLSSTLVAIMTATRTAAPAMAMAMTALGAMFGEQGQQQQPLGGQSHLRNDEIACRHVRHDMTG